MDVGKAIESRLAELGMTQKTLADKTGFTTVHINRIVRGHEKNIPLATLQKIFSVLGQRIDITVVNK